MLNPPPGEKAREITSIDLKKVADAWGLNPPDFDALTGRQILGGVAVVGRINERAWVDDAQIATDQAPVRRVAGVIHERYPLADQAAYEIDAPGLDGEIFEPGDIVLTVPFARYRSQPQPRDLIVVRRRRGDLANLTLRRATLEAGTIVLRPVLDGAATVEDGDELLRLVVGFMRYDV